MKGWSLIIKNKFAKNTLFILAEKGIALPLNFLAFVIVARQFGPFEFGVISFGLSMVALFAPFSKFAYETIITKHLSLGVPFASLFKVSFRLRLIGSFIVFAGLMGTVFFTLDSPSLITFIGILGLTIFLDAFIIYDSFFQSILKSQYSGYSRGISLIVGSALRIWIALIWTDLLLIALTFIVERIFTILLMYYFYTKNHDGFSHQNSSPISAKVLFRESLPLILTNLLILINFKIDQVMIQYFMGNEAVGVYASAVRFSEVWYMIPTAIMASYFPFITQNIENESLILKTLLRISLFLVLTSVGIAVLTTLISGPLVNIVLGKSYYESASVIEIHIWASLFFFAGHPVSKVLIAKNKTWINFTGKFAAVILNIGLNLWLIPTYGINGAAIATLISYALGYYFYYFFFVETRQLIWRITTEPIRMIYRGMGSRPGSGS